MLTIHDFEKLVATAGEAITLIEGQAVAWWATRYSRQLESQNLISRPVTSRDLDFWADRDQMDSFAKKIGANPQYPHRYEMTVLAGIIPIKINQAETTIEFLHTVPGLDISDPEATTVIQELNDATFRILDPISLSCAKLHALKNFSQEERQDRFHLGIVLFACKFFIEDAINKSPELGLWYCERLIKVCVKSNNRSRLERESLNVRDSVPIEAIQSASLNPSLSMSQRSKLDNFIRKRYRRL